MADLSWSDVDPALESFLQRHIFIPEVKAYRYGTRANSVIMQLHGTVWYCYASFDPPEEVAAGAAAGGAAPRAPGDAEFDVEVEGRVWRVMPTPAAAGWRRSTS